MRIKDTMTLRSFRDGKRCDGYECDRPSDYDFVSIERGSGTDLYLLLSQALVRYSGLLP